MCAGLRLFLGEESCRPFSRDTLATSFALPEQPRQLGKHKHRRRDIGDQRTAEHRRVVSPAGERVAEICREDHPGQQLCPPTPTMRRDRHHQSNGIPKTSSLESVGGLEKRHMSARAQFR